SVSSAAQSISTAVQDNQPAKPPAPSRSRKTGLGRKSIQDPPAGLFAAPMSSVLSADPEAPPASLAAAPVSSVPEPSGASPSGPSPSRSGTFAASSGIRSHRSSGASGLSGVGMVLLLFAG